MPVDSFNWVENGSQFNKNFVENCNEDRDEGHFLEIGVQYLEKLHAFHNSLLFLPEQMKLEKVEKLVANLHDKKKKFILHIRKLSKH